MAFTEWWMPGTEAEFAAGTATVQGAIPLALKDTHAHLARVHWSTHGVVR